LERRCVRVGGGRNINTDGMIFAEGFRLVGGTFPFFCINRAACDFWECVPVLGQINPGVTDKLSGIPMVRRIWLAWTNHLGRIRICTVGDARGFDQSSECADSQTETGSSKEVEITS